MYHVTMSKSELGISPSALETALRRAEMSPAELARATGISAATISLILSGKHKSISAVNLAKLAIELGVSIDFLMEFTEEPEPRSLMLGEMLLEITQVARKLTSRRQRDLLVMARAWLEEIERASGDRDRFIEDALSLVQEHGGDVDLAAGKLFDLLDQAAAARAARTARGTLLTDKNREQPSKNND